MLRSLSPSVWQSRANHVLGIIPGMVNGLIAASVVALLLLTVPISDQVSEAAEQSRLATQLTPPAEWLQERLSPVFDEAIRRSMTKLTVEPGSEETVKLHFKDSTTEERFDLEAEMLEMVNRERAEAGLKPLRADTALRTVAIAHSRDMFARGYFSHNSPEGKDPFDRMKKAHIRYTAAGENLALARTLKLAHTGLMNSPGHRANILNPSYGRVGIGIADGGLHGLMVSQEFRN
ncbi:CAP domain-containing protein [Sediminibacterium soli]|uniref:CAP domain-containing protein n=1 Tax=Sediminibacterium soli TaxID=2698829 RepID=UPI001F16D337|nr:CAP domain-containing protein [Sediminibacterium soli]